VPAGATSGQHLVIVESPAKAKTIAKYLGKGYEVLASVGHIRDLPEGASEIPEAYRGQPWARLAVNVDDGFAPIYVVSPRKKKTVTELKRALKDADELLLATDEDREGEAIAWHLLEVLQPKVPVRRMVFHEITKEAIQESLANTRDLDFDLVDAQETRRIVDRLVGYEVSPVLWRKVKFGLSAGRVQSVAVRLIVQRERERIAFTAAQYCDVRGRFAPDGFKGQLVSLDGRRIATGKDFDDTGALRNDALALTMPQAEQLAEELLPAQFVVEEVKQRPGTRRPGAPFTTSTLQQEAGRRLKWGAERTMSVAQSLYEGGYITYMRTDSVQLSQQAIAAARSQAEQLYGADYVHPTVRSYKGKSANAQEAHEAIRPAGEVFRTPGQLTGQLVGDAWVLYEMIWKRTVSSQMADARISTTTLLFSAPDAQQRRAQFSASGTVTLFKGFRAAYEETVVEDRNAQDAVTNVALPNLAQGDVITAAELLAAEHQTKPPARYTEASLVQALEERGIGRPSTYAATIKTIINRKYVWKKGSALVPSFLAFAVTRLLEEHFASLVDYDFTREMEEVLDAISRGDTARLEALQRFYRGGADSGFEGLQPLLDKLGEIDARAVCTMPIEGTEVVLRVGKYGDYLERPSDGQRANLRGDLPPDELTADFAAEAIERGNFEMRLGEHPDTGLPIVAREGRYGPYVMELLPQPEEPTEASEGQAKRTSAKKAAGPKPRTASLLRSMALESVTLDDAVRLLSLPRVVGTDPDTGEAITAQNGRYGPYLKRATDSRSLADEEQLFTVTLEEALEIFRQPKRGRGATSTPGRPLGEDPATGKPVVVKSGRYGPYVTDGETNATLRSGDDADAVTLERAAELLAEKRAKGPAQKRPAKKAAKKSAAKKTAAKKAAAKKTAAKKTAAKKTAAKKTAAKKAAANETAATVPAGTGAEALSSAGTAPWD
jgi:DNA topoisomerase-1